MDKYFCVFQLPSQATPSRVSFEAAHGGAAIIKMMELAKVTNTMELEQAEILKLVRDAQGKTGYLPVFVKEKDAPKGRAILANTMPVIAAPVIAPSATEEETDVYKLPYTVEVL